MRPTNKLDVFMAELTRLRLLDIIAWTLAAGSD
jgi:hypothetical protein